MPDGSACYGGKICHPQLPCIVHVVVLQLFVCNCFMYLQANIFSEYNMEGVSVTDANEIYLETVPENLVRCLRSAQNAKSVKIKLTKKQTPCLTFEVELVSHY